jgi:uncharacterized protein YkwD
VSLLRYSSHLFIGALVFFSLMLVVPMPARAAAPAPTAATLVAEVLQLSNNLRAANGCGPLALTPQLTASALRHSTDLTRMGDALSHTGTDGSTFAMRIEQAGYTNFTLVAENIAAGYETPQDVVDGWYNSPLHRANLLNCQLKDVGIGYVYTAQGDFNYYWTADFGSH